MKMKKQIVAILLVLMAITLASAGLAAADSVPILTYDVEQTPVSGFGCWSHTYDGIIDDTGRKDTVSVSCTPDGINHIANYNDGSGTLNDGVFSGSHLFVNNRIADDGLPIVPVITLHLANAVRVTQINIFGGGFGDLAAATVEINGVSESVPMTSIVGSNGILDLTTTSLASLTTSTIVLRDFVVSPYYGTDLDQFSLAELTVDGCCNPPPPPPLTIDLSINPFGSVVLKTGVKGTTTIRV